MRYLILFSFLISFSLPAFSMGKKIPKATVTFHTEAAKEDHPRMVFPHQAPGGTKYFHRFPVAPTKEVIHYKPFPAQDGSIGAMFQLSKVGTQRLSHMTTQAQNKWMMSVINGRPVNVVFIDKPVNDGIMVVWKGMNQRDVDLLDLEIIRSDFDPKVWKKHKSEVKKRLKRQLKNEKTKRKP